MQQRALFWHIRTLTDSPLALGVVGLVNVIPILLASLFAGVTADVFNRRKIMLITQLGMGGAALTLALLTSAGQIALWQIYLL